MKRLFIHAGTQKTGTTAIADFLLLNNSRLDRLGISFPDIGLLVRKRHDILAQRFRWGREDPTQPTAETRLQYTNLVDYINKSNSDTFILLNESLYGSFVDGGGDRYRELFGLLANVCEITVVLYLRRQDLWIESLYRQHILGGRRTGVSTNPLPTFPEYLALMGSTPYFDYLAGVQNFDIPQIKNLVIRPYEKTQLVNGDAIDDFMSLLGVSPDQTDDYLPPARVNTYHHSREDEIIWQQFQAKSVLLGEHTPRDILKQYNRTMRLVPRAALATGEARYYLSPAERIDFYSQFVNANDLLAQKYLNQRKLFEVEPSRDEDFYWTPPQTTDAAGWFTVLSALAPLRSQEISGKPIFGGILTVELPASIVNATLSFQWYRGDVEIAGATESDYCVTAEDLGENVCVKITATKSPYQSRSVVTKPRHIPLGRISRGVVAVAVPETKLAAGVEVFANPSGFIPEPIAYTYQWLRNNVEISGATARSYTLSSADAGTKLKVRVTAQPMSGYDASAPKASMPLAIPRDQ